jgi:flagellar biosynthetic protein FliP
MIRRKKFAAGLLLLSVILMFLASGCSVQDPGGAPLVNITVANTQEPQAMSSGLQILLLLTVLSLAPAILLMLTSFTRIVIVLGFVRNALAIQQVPPNQVLIGLAMFLTFFVMAPTWQTVNQEALQPYMNGQIDQQTAYERGIEPIREFLFEQTRDKDLALFVRLAKIPRPATRADVPTHVLIPAFIISELKTAFQMGVMIFIPFLVIDMVIASALMSMGMMMLPPSLVSMPFKLLLFVLVDGWALIIQSLVVSFG